MPPTEPERSLNVQSRASGSSIMTGKLEVSLTDAFHTGVPAIIDSQGNCPNDKPSWVINVISLFRKKNLKTMTTSRIQFFDKNPRYLAHGSHCFSLYIGRVSGNAYEPFILPLVWLIGCIYPVYTACQKHLLRFYHILSSSCNETYTSYQMGEWPSTVVAIIISENLIKEKKRKRSVPGPHRVFLEAPTDNEYHI